MNALQCIRTAYTLIAAETVEAATLTQMQKWVGKEVVWTYEKRPKGGKPIQKQYVVKVVKADPKYTQAFDMSPRLRVSERKVKRFFTGQILKVQKKA